MSSSRPQPKFTRGQEVKFKARPGRLRVMTCCWSDQYNCWLYSLNDSQGVGQPPTAEIYLEGQEAAPNPFADLFDSRGFDQVLHQMSKL